MATDLEKYLDMSLDEYIATRKGGLRNSASKSILDMNATSNESAQKLKGDRPNSKINEAMDEDELLMENDSGKPSEGQAVTPSHMLNKSLGIWRGPSDETNYIDLDYMQDEFDEMFNDPELKKNVVEKQAAKQSQNQQRDLRDRLNNSSLSLNSTNYNHNVSNAKKQQEQGVNSANKQNNVNFSKKWSNVNLLQHQSMSLTSLNTDSGLNGNGQYRRRWNNNKNFRRRFNDGCGNRGSGNVNFNGGQNMNWNNRNGGGFAGVNSSDYLHMNNNGRIQRFNQRYSQDVLNKNIKSVLDQINGNHLIYNHRPAGSVRDLTIECPSTLISGRLASSALQTPTTQQTLIAPKPTQTPSDLKALLGVNESNLKAETMAMWAGKLLDLFQSGQAIVHKPIYDIQIQKEIHELQGKSLLYKCPGGEVVSSDGSGIDNCKITPNSSGVTLNYRFG